MVNYNIAFNVSYCYFYRIPVIQFVTLLVCYLILNIGIIQRNDVIIYQQVHLYYTKMQPCRLSWTSLLYPQVPIYYYMYFIKIGNRTNYFSYKSSLLFINFYTVPILFILFFLKLKLMFTFKKNRNRFLQEFKINLSISLSNFGKKAEAKNFFLEKILYLVESGGGFSNLYDIIAIGSIYFSVLALYFE